MYASALGENAVERYAMFLTSLELSADADERKLALTRAQEYGLDMERVATVTAERTVERAIAAGGAPLGLEKGPLDKRRPQMRMFAVCAPAGPSKSLPFVSPSISLLILLLLPLVLARSRPLPFHSSNNSKLSKHEHVPITHSLPARCPS